MAHKRKQAAFRMDGYKRKEASFSLCGLNCCLCPRFHTDGSSKCPGCGGNDFSSKHPSCAVITCNKKHDTVEFCFECSLYPCKRYQEPSKTDSFISYKNVLRNLTEAKRNLKKYLGDLKKKHKYLINLISTYNDGKSKGFYCIAVNLLPISVLDEIMDYIKNNIKENNAGVKDKVKAISGLMKSKAKDLNIELILRK